MKYTIYKTTNLKNNKIYIGCHKTKDPNDDYLGSGKHLRRAIEKYGIENFKKEVLYVFDDEASMFAKEKELVTEEFCKQENTYNICPGGQGGWGYINSAGLNIRSETEKKIIYDKLSKKLKGQKTSLATREGIKKAHKNGKYRYNNFLGKSHSEKWREEHSKRMKEISKGKNNSQYDTMWITNGKESRKIKKIEDIPEGWYKGRVIKTELSGR